MAATMEKTRHAGIWKRGGRYVFSYRLNGKQRWESARTLSEAQRLKARRSADADRGELHERSRLTFREYAEEWVESYTGRGRSGFRESTREGYRHDLTQWVFPYWGDERKLTEVTPRDIAQLVSHLTSRRVRAGARWPTTPCATRQPRARLPCHGGRGRAHSCEPRSEGPASPPRETRG